MNPLSSQSTARSRFAVNLRTARLSRGFSQEELGARAGLHRNYIGSVERNEKNISIDTIERLANALGVDVLDLLTRERA
jgi:transcriptional regulator with XRE-family HTH domain